MQHNVLHQKPGVKQHAAEVNALLEYPEYLPLFGCLIFKSGAVRTDRYRVQRHKLE